MRICALTVFLGLCAAISWGQSAVSIRDAGAAPLSVIADVMDIQPVINPATSEITLSAGTAHVTLIPFVPFLLQDITTHQLPYGPFPWKGETMAPIRVLAGALGFQINWDDTAKQVTLDNPTTKKSRTIPIDAYDAVTDFNAFAAAIQKGDLDKVRTLLERDPTIMSCYTDTSDTPFTTAAALGQDAIVQYMLDHGAGYVTPPSWPMNQPWDPPAFALIAAWGQMQKSTLATLAKRSYYPRPNLLGQLSRWHQHQQVADCEDQIKKIGMAMMMYTWYHHQNKFPDAATWFSDIKSDNQNQPANGSQPTGTIVGTHVISSPFSLICPDRPDLAIGYGYNAFLSGRDQKSLTQTADIVLLADCSNAHHLLLSEDDIDWNRHRDGAVVCFADGHIEVLKRDAQHPLQFAEGGWGALPADLTAGAVTPAPAQTPVDPALAKAIQAGKVDEVRTLLTATPALLHTYLGGDTDMLPLTLACAGGQRDVVTLLLQMGATPGDQDASAAALVAGAPDIVLLLPRNKP